MKQFIKKDGLQLVNGGYLSNMEGAPVFNAEFVKLQKRAEYICTFASFAKGKDLVGKDADITLEEIKAKVKAELEGKKPEYVAAPKKVVKKLTEQLAEEAMSFMKYEENSGKVTKINNFLQEFNTLAEFEEFGLFFTDDIVKLNKIYTMKEVTDAVSEFIDLLN